MPQLVTNPAAVHADSSSAQKPRALHNALTIFGQIGASINEVPKVKRYLQFTQSEPQPSAKSPSTSLKAESFIPVLGTKPQSMRSESTSEESVIKYFHQKLLF